MTNRDALRICIVVSIIALAAALSGCGPPPPPNGIDVGPLVLDPEPPELDRPLTEMDRLGQLKQTCWKIILTWHETAGWDARIQWAIGELPTTVKQRGGFGTLDAALRWALREVAR